jgi:hypothetical protein
MSDLILEYDSMESIVEYSKALGKQAEEYGESLDSEIIAAIETVTGDSSGNLISASDAVCEKIKDLKQKSEAFYQFAAQVSNLLEVAQQTDQEVADAIAMQKDRFLDHHKSLRIENWKEKLLGLLVDFEMSSNLLTLISKILTVRPDSFQSSKDTIKDWYKSAEGKTIRTEVPAGIATSGIPGWIPASGNEEFPGSKNGNGIGDLDLKSNILKWYKYPGMVADMTNEAVGSENNPDRNLWPYERDLKSLVKAVYAKKPLKAAKYFGKYLWDRYPGYYSYNFTQMGIATGMDPEMAKIAGDFSTMTLIEGFAVVTVNGMRAFKNLKTGEIIYDEYVVIGSGAGNIAKSPKTASRAIGEGGKVTEGTGGRVGSSEVSGLLDKMPEITGSTRDKLLSKIQNSDLGRIVNELYRPGAKVGDGGTASILTQEFLEGTSTHLAKAQQRLTQLNNLAKSGKLGLNDIDILDALRNDLSNAIDLFK